MISLSPAASDAPPPLTELLPVTILAAPFSIRGTHRTLRDMARSVLLTTALLTFSLLLAACDRQLTSPDGVVTLQPGDFSGPATVARGYNLEIDLPRDPALPNTEPIWSVSSSNPAVLTPLGSIPSNSSTQDQAFDARTAGTATITAQRLVGCTKPCPPLTITVTVT
jgi:hypothetical protein